MAFIKKGQQEDLFIKNKDTDIDTANVAVANINHLNDVLVSDIKGDKLIS